MGAIEFALLAISSIIAVIEPFSTTAIFGTLARSYSSELKSKIVAKSMLISLIVLVFFAMTGQLFFQVFNITIAAFQIAGGILLVAVAFEMLYPGRMKFSIDASEDISIVPIAFPLTAGPGSITTVILLASQASNPLESYILFIGIFAAILLSYVVMRYSTRTLKLLGDEGLRVLTALMAIIVLAIAIQFIINGVGGAVTNWQRSQ